MDRGRLIWNVDANAEMVGSPTFEAGPHPELHSDFGSLCAALAVVATTERTFNDVDSTGTPFLLAASRSLLPSRPPRPGERVSNSRSRRRSTGNAFCPYGCTGSPIRSCRHRRSPGSTSLIDGKVRWTEETHRMPMAGDESRHFGFLITTWLKAGRPHLHGTRRRQRRPHRNERRHRAGASRAQAAGRACRCMEPDQ